MTVGAADPVALSATTVSDCFLDFPMVSKTTKQFNVRLSNMDAYDEIFGVSWRERIKEDFRRRAQSARRAVEMYETGRDIALVQNSEGDQYWVFIDELSDHDYEVVLDSTLPQAVDISGFEPRIRPFSDHDYDEDYLP